MLSAGRRVELLRSISEAANEILGSNTRIIAADASPDYSAACAKAETAFRLPPTTQPEYIPALRQLCINQDINLVIPTIDHELILLSKERQNFSEIGIDIVISSPSLVDSCRDKRKSISMFKSIGIKCPELLSPNSLSYPCFIKPVSGSCSQGVRAVLGPEYLTEAEKYDDRILFQEFVPSTWTEYSVDCWYSRDGRLISIVPRQRLETRGGEISKGVTRRGPVFNLLKPSLDRLKGARGCLTVQVFLSPTSDRLLGIEINPRFGGGYPLSHAAGASFPEFMIYEWMLGKHLTWTDNWRADMLMLRYDTMVMRGFD